MNKLTKKGYTGTDRAVIYGRSDQKESPVDWTPHEGVTRHATKADSLLSTVFWSNINNCLAPSRWVMTSLFRNLSNNAAISVTVQRLL